MKNLNIEKANKPTLFAVKSVNMKFFFSLCAVLFLLTASLSTKAQSSHSSPDNSVVWEDWGYELFYFNSFYNNESGLSNNWGDSNSGNDRWIKVVVPTAGTLYVGCGTVSGYDIFDSVLHLVDSTGSYTITSDDDSAGGSYGVGAGISYYVTPGTYYIVLDGTDKNGHVKNGGVGITFRLTF